MHIFKVIFVFSFYQEKKVVEKGGVYLKFENAFNYAWPVVE